MVARAPRVAKSTKVPKSKTEGQKRLLDVDGTEAELAAKLGCGSAIIGHWRRGRRVPGKAHRHKIELLFGIARRAWDVAPGTELATPQSAASASSEDVDTLTITKTQIDAILDGLKNEALTDAAAAKLRDTMAKLLALRARLERDREMAEDRAVREHPAWTRTKAAILRALKPYPEAAAAVAESLDS